MAQAFDAFRYALENLDDPTRRMLAITPSNAQDLAYVVRQIEVGGGGQPGNVAVLGVDNADNEVVILQVDVGLPINGKLIRRVLSAGTTATGLIGSV